MSTHVVSLIIGIIFGSCLLMAGFTNPDRIVSALRLKDLHIIRTVIVFLLVGLIGTWIVGSLGTTAINNKPAAIITLIIGGLFVGGGLGLTGYSPCTSLASAASGRIDAVTTIIGMFFGAYIYVIIYPSIILPLEQVHNYGKVTLPQITNVSNVIWIIPTFAAGSLVLFLTLVIGSNDSKQSGKSHGSVINEKSFDEQNPKPIFTENDSSLKEDFIGAAEIFYNWKNLLFLIITVCLLLLQISFWLLSEDYIEAGSNNITNVFSKITFAHITTILNISNIILVFAAVLYVLTIFFCLSSSFGAKLGGLRYISRAFLSALIAVILLLPWQVTFKSILLGAIYTPAELADINSVDKSQTFNAVLLYLRFVGYWAFVVLLLIRSQVYCHRWLKSIRNRIGQAI